MFVFICNKLNDQQIEELTQLDWDVSDLPETDGTAVCGHEPSLPGEYHSYIVSAWCEE